MIQIENLGEFSAGLDQWLEDCEDMADAAFRGLAVTAFSYIVLGTPEWSGNLAATWKLTIGAPATGYSETIFKELSPSGAIEDPYSKLSPNWEAVRHAFELAKDVAPFVRLGADAYITNTAPYAGEVEQNRSRAGKLFLRSVNLPVEMVHAAHDKFNGLGDLSVARLETLAKATL